MFDLIGLNKLTKEIKAMAQELDRLKAEVAQNTAVIGSAVTLINGLAARIREIQTDPAALTALADELDSNANTLADAVAANTPTPTA